MRPFVSSSVLVLATMGTALTAQAQDNTAEMRKVYQRAAQHFDLAEYTEALADFKEAYRLRPDPVLLYNIAQCYRLLNQKEEALKLYRSYLAKSPNAKNREEVETKIAALQEAIQSQQKAVSTPKQDALNPGEATTNTPTNIATSADKTPSTRSRPVYKKWWLWTAVGAVVAAGVGIGLGVGLTRSNPPTFPTVTF